MNKSQIRKMLVLVFILVIIWFIYTMFPSFGPYLMRQVYELPSKTDTQFFKGVLEDSVGMIDLTYDSGSAGVNEQFGYSKIFNDAIGFDLTNPETIIKIAMPEFKNFMTVYEPPTGESPGNNSAKVSPAPPLKANQTPGLKTDSSSITDSSDNTSKSYQNIMVTNIAKETFNIKDLLNAPLPYTLPKKGPQMLLFHTHTHEGYSDGKSFGVLRAGEVLSQLLEKRYGFDVIHNGTINDNDYNSSYTSAWATTSGVLKGNRNLEVLFDIHRDGLEASKGPLRVASKFNGKTYAQLMFVVGTDVLLNNPGWKNNFSLALKIQKRLQEVCPGIARPIYLSKKRYNEQIRNGALIIEVGGNGNKVEEVNNSMEVLSKCLNDVLRPYIK